MSNFAWHYTYLFCFYTFNINNDAAKFRTIARQLMHGWHRNLLIKNSGNKKGGTFNPQFLLKFLKSKNLPISIKMFERKNGNNIRSISDNGRDCNNSDRYLNMCPISAFIIEISSYSHIFHDCTRSYSLSNNIRSRQKKRNYINIVTDIRALVFRVKRLISYNCIRVFSTFCRLILTEEFVLQRTIKFKLLQIHVFNCRYKN